MKCRGDDEEPGREAPGISTAAYAGVIKRVPIVYLVIVNIDHVLGDVQGRREGGEVVGCAVDCDWCRGRVKTWILTIVPDIGRICTYVSDYLLRDL